jgi:hypothetical protein
MPQPIFVVVLSLFSQQQQPRFFVPVGWSRSMVCPMCENVEGRTKDDR